MQKIIFATGNAGKMKEIRMILSDLTFQGSPVEILSMKEAGIDADIEENGSSFEENAVIKAKAAAGAPGGQGAFVLADDSGLEIDYLNKEPGIYSARYMGRRLLTMKRTGISLNGWRACRSGSVRQGLSVPLPAYCRMAGS